MTIAVLGVSGHTGRVVAEQLLAKGLSIRVIVRDVDKGSVWKAQGAEVAVANLGNEHSLIQALEGASGAYLLIPPHMAAPDFRDYQHKTIDKLAAAIESARVGHAVFLSSIGAEHASGTGPIAAMNHAEKTLGAIRGLQIAFVRAAYFMENHATSFGMLGQGLFPSFIPASLAFEMVATRDIGVLAAQLLAEKKTGVHQIAGPAPRTIADVATILTSVLGKPIAVHEAPVTAMSSTLQGVGLPRSISDLYQEMTEALISGRLVFDPRLPLTRGSTTLETTLQQLSAGAVK